MTEKMIRDAYVRIRTIDQTIPDDVLDFMRDASIEKLKEIGDNDFMSDVTCRYFIYVFYQVGNIDSRDVKTIDEQPKDGFETEQEAEEHLKKLILDKKGHFFDRSWYKFTIMKTWNSLSAV